MKPSPFSGCLPLWPVLRTNVPGIISFTKSTTAILLVLMMVMGCGNSKREKIKLHARDSAAVAISGRWDLINKLPADRRSNQALQKYNIIALALNEDHTASIFSKDSALIKEFRGSWTWNRKTSSGSSASGTEKSPGILITGRISADTILEFELEEGTDHGIPVLIIPDVASFGKEKLE